MSDNSLNVSLASQGFPQPAELFANLGTAPLVEHAVRKGEGRLTKDGALLVDTGKFTGRSVKDKFVVRDAATEDTINWGKINQPMSVEHWSNLKAEFLAAMQDQKELYVADLFGGSQPEYRVNVRVVTQLAWHSLFVRTLLVRPSAEELASFTPEYTILNLPSFKADPERHGCRSDTVIAVNFTEKLILIGNTEYSGEMKKGVFGLLNFLLPAQGVMPMHCSANIGADGTSAIFFGLSGTGKTTLSADASRTLIGDDEHGWSDTAVFNFEGGCYAKMINLSAEGEPEIYATTKMFGTILENVTMDEATRELDFTDSSKTENTRGAYPIEFIPNTSAENLGPPPSNIIFLTADAFGVLPPIARLTPEQAMYHFLSGYTAKVAGTEIGVTEPEATFSTCFGAAFMPRHPSVYGNLLKERIAKGGAQCWLVNTGWSGGKATQEGIKRMPIKATRALLNAALDGSLNDATFKKDPNFGFEVPVEVPGVETRLLDPRGAWADQEEYDKTAQELVHKFVDNFQQFAEYVDQSVRDAAPAAA
ncbi:MAG: phosphoenolpyruvate carboxykinase (ATP) [Novosphingobium sp. 28-62-57]|uniref:phosphoenolpyruvate carboxykinase n=1 Tax=unclassified Novosphingobium TaxID=2644732 RepID=UPI000BD00A3E|nr:MULTISPECIES: phosphoenolpyruvate carboxykinase [unclassified Novosphingobium]OYW48631.1 MAG: phosphoenolpyruvate carboxykinase (ATP) [Novosphingobium sp. 12-62-10]OYZ10183.1 MAG: phosphoenolpyruvate carboxykinase (ATP) [Novosphingobium sp. 28-62-57]OZA36004.1 MAG: phosphoenolpyruvate carboxykinase (ATP) [Novosphingobium sp. 17-62-9]HQS70232.1 phosphoenolpyruvate carboxykinase [Novosphingobium sp.]